MALKLKVIVNKKYSSKLKSWSHEFLSSTQLGR